MAAPTLTPQQPAADPTRTRRRRLPGRATWARLAAAAAGGVTLFLSFPPRSLWWLAPVGIALFGLAVYGRRARAGFGYGTLFGAAFLLPLLWWVGVYVGSLAPLALGGVEALFFGLVGAGVAATSRLPGAPVWAAAMWVAGEAARSRVPFGGFPWAKLAFGQPEGAFLPLVALGGTALVGFAITLCGFGAAALVRRLATRPRRPAWRTAVLPALAVVLPVLAGAASWPLVRTDAEAGTATAALIQGNVPRAGLEFNAQRRAVLDNHARRTEQLAADVRAGRVPQPDFVIWPENSSDIDPFRNADAYAVIDQAVRAVNAPTALGAVLVASGGKSRNTVLQWDPGTGPVDTYTKRQLQPFGETMPLREFVRLFSPEVDRVGWEFTPGHEARSFTMGPARVGLATCYEVAFDNRVTDTVRSGAQVLAVPTNNATFGVTDMTYQQLAMSRVRAVEHGRTVLVAATSGVSAVVLPDGTVQHHTGLFTADALVAQVPLRTTATLATRVGALPEWTLSALAMAALGWVVACALLRRPTGAPRAGTAATAGDSTTD
ncbi:apolipoprotein N-acyltransferase [Longimycelium tulufanense]|uniref:Apolipoprotein N-acyltransferase n=1 Tax=Longimycelium tulufanense TaxID=907463 RepID=A0A8J3CJW1_9PSEU|nr:apolipoprotein N-acyltransferase [Longimycelium tulufanense]GGM78768.1 apolipoprotein N-acyltransferase [Longimycelium tulufanense]